VARARTTTDSLVARTVVAVTLTEVKRSAWVMPAQNKVQKRNSCGKIDP